MSFLAKPLQKYLNRFFQLMHDVEKEYENEEVKKDINYLVLILMFVAIIPYVVLNTYEPQIDVQLDFFELMFLLSQFAAGIFGIFVGLKYWGSKVFGKAYIALGLGYIFAGLGSTTFIIYETVFRVSNPFPGLMDVFLIPFYLLILFHLVTCVRHFKKKLSRNEKLLIVILPLSCTFIFILAYSFPSETPGSIPDLLSRHIQVGDITFKLVEVNSTSTNFQHIIVDDVIYKLVPVEITTTKYEQIPPSDSAVNLIPIVFTNFSLLQPYEGDAEYWMGFSLVIFYFLVININLAFAIIGTQIFRNTVLGSAWGLLLFGIILTSIGDIIYFFNALFTYDKTVDLGFWVLGFMIISYALYLHRKRL